MTERKVTGRLRLPRNPPYEIEDPLVFEGGVYTRPMIQLIHDFAFEVVGDIHLQYWGCGDGDAASWPDPCWNQDLF